MKWKKSGLLYCHTNDAGSNAYTTVPFAIHLHDDVFRIYFSPRDEENRSYPFYIDIDIFSKQIHGQANNALISPGNAGAFDDAGCVLFQVLEHDETRYMYYSGWTLAKRVPFTFFIGLATAQKNTEEFHKYSAAPIIAANRFDPYLAGAPWVMIEDGLWRMWYITGLGWQPEPGNLQKHFYTVTYAESQNGIDWKPSGKICIPFKSELEYAIARPHVIKHKGLYKMWYSYRETTLCKTYQVGYAESADGIDWVRKDEEAGIVAADEGWDSEMICYPFIFEHKDKFYMVYNGNAYGKTGMGLAVLENW